MSPEQATAVLDAVAALAVDAEVYRDSTCIAVEADPYHALLDAARAAGADVPDPRPAELAGTAPVVDEGPAPESAPVTYWVDTEAMEGHAAALHDIAARQPSASGDASILVMIADRLTAHYETAAPEEE